MASSSQGAKTMEILELEAPPAVSSSFAGPSVAVEEPDAVAGDMPEQQAMSTDALKQTLGSTKDMYPYKALLAQDATVKAKHASIVTFLTLIIQFFRALVPFMSPKKRSSAEEAKQLQAVSNNKRKVPAAESCAIQATA